MTFITIGSWLGEVWVNLWLSLCTVVYGFITLLYRIFLYVANVNLFSKDVFEKITGRLYIVMSIAMLFIFAYNLVIMIIDPDGKQKGSMAKVVKDTMLSLVLVVLLPTIFNYLYIAQYHILNSNVIDNILLSNHSVDTNCDKYQGVNIKFEGEIGWFAKFLKYGGAYVISPVAGVTSQMGELIWEANGGGGGISNAQNNLYDSCKKFEALNPSYLKGATLIPGTIFSAFFYPNQFSMEDCEEWILNNKPTSDIFKDETAKICQNYYFDMTMTKYTGTTAPILKDQYLIKQSIKDESPLEFNYFFALIAGCLACYMYICYVLKIGVRVAKLGFLQIISPIPVMLRIIPGQGIFKKWLDQLKSTYLDVFIRVAIIDFTLLGISMAPDLIDTLFSNTYSEGGWLISTLSLVVIILGLMQFANEAPQLFKDLFGGMGGDFSLKSPKKQLSENKLAMGTAGLLGGGVSSAVKNWNKNKNEKPLARIRSSLGGFGGGAFRGARAGYGAKTFKDLKANTSNAIDETLEAGDRRDIRQSSPGGTLGYYKAKASSSISNWAHGGSLSMLQKQKTVLEKAKGNYDNVISTTKDFITSHSSEFVFDNKTVEQYQMEKDKTHSDYINFDEEKFKDNLLKTNPSINEADIQSAIENRKKILSDRYVKANADCDRAITKTTDALIQMQRNNNTTEGDTKIEITEKNSAGVEITRTVDVHGGKQVTNLDNIISTADNYATTNAAEIKIARGGNEATDLSGSDRNIRKTLAADVSKKDSDIAKQRAREEKK